MRKLDFWQGLLLWAVGLSVFFFFFFFLKTREELGQISSFYSLRLTSEKHIANRQCVLFVYVTSITKHFTHGYKKCGNNVLVVLLFMENFSWKI